MPDSVACRCKAVHPRRRIVLTGGPGAGKTAVLELIKKAFCAHVRVLPESASILFSGGFPRGASVSASIATQRAIFNVQRELECVVEADSTPAIALCDRGTIDGLAYVSVDPEVFLASMGTTRSEQFARYDAVIHLHTPGIGQGYDHVNPVRLETQEEALALDARIEAAWNGHPRRFFVTSEADFLDKARQALDRIRAELPPCCRGHLVSGVDLVP